MCFHIWAPPENDHNCSEHLGKLEGFEDAYIEEDKQKFIVFSLYYVIKRKKTRKY